MNYQWPELSTPSDPDPDPESTSGLSPAIAAIGFTSLLLQLQVAFQGNVRDVLPVLIATLLAMAGVSRSLVARPRLGS